MSGPEALKLFHFRLTAVRHLAWMIQAPQLLEGPNVLDLNAYLPDNFTETLYRWDQHPGLVPELLKATPHYRLGYYFESLYQCLMQDLSGWQVLARNLPVRAKGKTLGELDFVLRNPHTGLTEHHEIAVKFYLGYPGNNTTAPGWYGPNPADRLDLKTARILEQQSQRRLLPETAATLAQLGIPVPQLSRVYMPGYLFYPQHTELAPPEKVPEKHLRGLWQYLDNLDETDIRSWIPLRKPHWLGRWIQEKAPDGTDAEKSLADIAVRNSPGLFARLQQDVNNGLWVEQERVFVVPARWPRQQADTDTD